MKQMRRRVPMLYYWTVWEQKGLYQDTWQVPLMGMGVVGRVPDPTNSTGMALTTMGNLPGTDSNGTDPGTRGRWLVLPAAWGLLGVTLGAGIS